MKWQLVYPALVVAALALIALVLGFFPITISIERTEPDSPFLPVSHENSKPPAPPQSASNITSSAPTATTSTQVAEANSEAANKSVSNSSSTGARSAILRMSNQTDQPVRIALLARGSAANVPAHWDFAPNEGSEKGLVLSLPEGKLKLEKGDIIVAFAQDGSRRYWGPFVVGETPSPVWNGQVGEWELVLR